MTVSGFLAIFGIGCGGGAVAELSRWWGLRESPSLPAYATSPRYWAITAVMVGVGGFLAVLYGTGSQNAILVLNIGVSAPLIIQALAKTNPVDRAKSPAGPAPSEPGILNFLRGR
ncbi:hypothetical protein [Streptacidiphilus rugosus]|uniref:hypothetical protein n=1 Tax=Streptacidiphilus rugosus TaxID=405783 RepID=UPI0005673E53|nr:hypothetical protein [Streptacidiphilus rugosus]